MEKNLIKIIKYLYSKEGNFVKINKNTTNELDIEDKELQDILKTQSKNKNFIEGTDHRCGSYHQIHLLWGGIQYLEESNKPIYKKVIRHIEKLNGFYTIIISFFALTISILSLYISIISK